MNNVPIKIIRFVDSLYKVEVASRGAAAPKILFGPIGARELIDKLKSLGCHQVDIGDALYDCDPKWLDRLD